MKMDMLHKCKLLVFLQQSVQELCLVELRQRARLSINFFSHDFAKATHMSMFCIKMFIQNLNLDFTTIYNILFQPLVYEIL